MEAIRFKNVSFSYEANEGNDEAKRVAAAEYFALHNVDFSVSEGEFVAVLGHNGSGKSTLARLTNGLLSPTSGEISIFDLSAANSKNLFAIRSQVGIVFQNPDNQMVASIVEDDVAFGPENIGLKREEIGERITFALDAVGMSEYRYSTPSRLSGGQKQRIAIASVLALKPKIMILDESTAMLDPRGRKEVMDVILRLNKEEKITVLLITHFPEEAMLADRAIVMSRGEIVMEGKPQDVLCKQEELEAYNLTLPRPVKICQKLREGGINVYDTLSPEELADGICKRFEELGVKKSEIGVENTQTDGAGTRGTEENAVGDVVAKNLTHVYNPLSPFETYALNGVDLTIEKGAFFGIIGHTGSGKSTFVQYLNALKKLKTAEKKYKPKKRKKGEPQGEKTVLTVDGFDLTDKHTDFKTLRAKVGMVFQYPEYQLFAETVFEDVAFGLKNFSEKPLDEEETAFAVKAALETVGLNYEEIKNRSPFELSGGQKRRVAIAGVIVTKPEILVLDEPAAGLDPLGKEEIMQLLHKIHAEWCRTVIIVSHDMDEIAENCTDAAVFFDGKVAMQAAPKQLFATPAPLFEMGLDIPFTAKVCAVLKGKGYSIFTDFTTEDFVAKTLAFLHSGGAGMDITENTSAGGTENE